VRQRSVLELAVIPAIDEAEGIDNFLLGWSYLNSQKEQGFLISVHIQAIFVLRWPFHIGYLSPAKAAVARIQPY
jgi:hypothetical protein